MAILRNVPKTFTFEDQRLEINEIAQDLYDLDLQEENDVELIDFSVTVNAPSGTGNLAYSIVGTFPNESGSFLFTPPDLSPYWVENTTQIANWDTAFSWGNHAIAGYITGIGSLSIGALIDVDVTTTAPTTGQRLNWNGTHWVPGNDVGIQWNQLSVLKPNPGASGSGDVTYNNSNGEFTYTPPELGNFATKASTDDNEPSTPYDGQLWWKSDEGKLKIYYQDVDSSQWVDSSPAGIQLSDLQVQTGPAQTSSALSYDNTTGIFTYNPSVTTGNSGGGISLSNLSVTSNNAGTAGLTYDDTTGVFSYTPPDLSGYSLSPHTHSYSLHDLSNVNAPNPSSGQVLKWNGSEWAPGSDLVGTGTGGIALTDLFIGNPQTPSGNGAIYYDNTTGEFNYTPPVLFSESYNDLTDKPTIPAAVNSDWSATSGVEEILNKPIIPAAQVQSDWNATTGLGEVLNKPYIAPISTAVPTSGDVLKWNGTEWAPGTDLQGSGGGGGGNVETGSIVIWSGTIANIPTGWQLCDGTNGSPDLRDKFVVGAGYDGATHASYLTGTEDPNASGSFANVFDGDLNTFSLADNSVSWSPPNYSNVTLTTLRIYCTKYMNASAGVPLLEVDGVDYSASVSGSVRDWVTIPVTSFTNITWKKSGNPGDAYGTSDYCLVFAIEVDGTVLTDPTSLYSTGSSGGSADAVVVEHNHTTSIDGTIVHPGAGGVAFANGGAGTYYGTTFVMDDAGVDGTGKNVPPYYALAYIYCTSGSSGGSSISLTDFSAQSATASGTGSLAYDNAGTFTYTPPDLSSFSTFSGSYNDLTDKPTIPAAQVQPDWNATSGLGEILNKPTIPGAYSLPTATTALLGGVKIDGTSITINNGVISSSVGATVSTDDNAPSTPSDGDLWWDSVNGRLNVYYQDDNSSQWIDTSGIGSTSSPSTVYTIEALLSPGIQLLDDGNAGATNRIFFDGGTGISVVRTNTNPHTIEFKSSFAATLDSKTTSYSLLAGDIGKTIKITSPGGGVNLQLTIPDLSSSLSFGDEVRIMNGAADSINVDASATTLYWVLGASAGGSGGYSTGNRQIHGYASVMLTYRGNNEWNIHGDGIF